ncbi:hypothetical protein MCOR02_006235 [Pyricularia oryzae]|nr:uncharacterized protein MGG_00873 [Pyricularia oryzae 70-15]EHA48514.1 hypothetical protein MGG_00873 [Pyricularia oryzae 70-15]KAH9434215.1 hypothetical protein MCOR02_006235 [Pyricularia oryzae]
MIVGCEFMEQHPGVLWDQQPPSRKVLLAVQPRMKKGESEQIAANRSRADQQAAAVAREGSK